MGTHPIFESDFDCLTVQIKIMFASKTVAELKAECKARGLPVTGKKQELIDRLTANESEKSMEDDLLEEPDVSLGEESQETEQPAEAESEEKAEEQAPAPVDNGVSEADEMEKKKLERAKKFGIEAPEVVNDKKKSRAERFGLVQASKEPASAEKDEMDAKKNRALRDLASTLIKNEKPNWKVWTLASMPKSLKNAKSDLAMRLFKRPRPEVARSMRRKPPAPRALPRDQLFCFRFCRLTRFLERILMEHIDLKSSLDSPLDIKSIFPSQFALVLKL